MTEQTEGNVPELPLHDTWLMLDLDNPRKLADYCPTWAVPTTPLAYQHAVALVSTGVTRPYSDSQLRKDACDTAVRYGRAVRRSTPDDKAAVRAGMLLLAGHIAAEFTRWVVVNDPQTADDPELHDLVDAVVGRLWKDGRPLGSSADLLTAGMALHRHRRDWYQPTDSLPVRLVTDLERIALKKGNERAASVQALIRTVIHAQYPGGDKRQIMAEVTADVCGAGWLEASRPAKS